MPRAESLLAGAAALVGCIGVASSLTPEFADRYQIVHGVLPPGVPNAARIVALAFGIALIWLSRSLARRRRRAWQLAVVIVIGSAIAHMAKGLDFEETTTTLVLLAALLRYRGRFTAPGDAGGGATAARDRAPRRRGRRSDARPRAARSGDSGPARRRLRGAPASCSGSQGSSSGCGRSSTRSSRRSPSGMRCASSSTRTAPTASRSSRSGRTRATTSRRAGRAFLAYRVVAGAALISGDPVGEECEFDGLLLEFRDFAHVRGWRLAVVGALGLQSRAATSASACARSRSATRRCSCPPSSHSRAARSARFGNRFRASRRPGIASAWSTPTTSIRSCARSSTRSRKRGVGIAPSGASRWRWTICTRPARRSRSPSPMPESSAASCTWRPRRPAAAGRSRRCAGCPARRTA